MSRARFEKLIEDQRRSLKQSVMDLPLDMSFEIRSSKVTYTQGQVAALSMALDFYKQAHKQDEDQ